MKHTPTLVAALWIVACAGPAFSEVWTLDATVRAALASSSAAEIGRLDADASGADALSARMSWYPTVSVSASANYVNKVMELRIPTRAIRFGDNDSYDFKLRVSQLVYDGGRLSALRAAGLLQAEMNLRQAEAAELAAEYQAKTAFFTVALAQENVKASEQSILEAKNHHADVLALRKEGMALEDDVLLSELRISQSEMGHVSLKADFERARALFRRVTGLAPDADVSVGSPDYSHPDLCKAQVGDPSKHNSECLIEWKTPRPSDSVFNGVPACACTRGVKGVPACARTCGVNADAETAFRNRPEFKALEAAIRSAGKTAESVGAERLPALGLSGAFNYGKPGLDLPKNEWMHYFSGGLSLSWNLWDWGRVSREVQKAEINRKKTEKTIEDLKLTVARQMTEALAGYNEARQRVSLAQQSAEYAKRHLELVGASFKNGVATERDYDTAHALYTKSLYDAAASRIAGEISRAQVEYVLGIRYRGEKP